MRYHGAIYLSKHYYSYFIQLKETQLKQLVHLAQLEMPIALRSSCRRVSMQGLLTRFRNQDLGPKFEGKRPDRTLLTVTLNLFGFVYSLFFNLNTIFKGQWD